MMLLVVWCFAHMEVFCVYPLQTELLNEYAHFVDFSPVLPVLPCLCARLRFLLHLKIIKIPTTCIAA